MPKTPPITNDSKMKRKEYEKELHKLQVARISDVEREARARA